MYSKALGVPLLPWQMADLTAKELMRMNNMLEDVTEAMSG